VLRWQVGPRAPHDDPRQLQAAQLTGWHRTVVLRCLEARPSHWHACKAMQAIRGIAERGRPCMRGLVAALCQPARTGGSAIAILGDHTAEPDSPGGKLQCQWLPASDGCVCFEEPGVCRGLAVNARHCCQRLRRPAAAPAMPPVLTLPCASLFWILVGSADRRQDALSITATPCVARPARRLQSV
jgi:hypothetical protein